MNALEPLRDRRSLVTRIRAFPRFQAATIGMAAFSLIWLLVAHNWTGALFAVLTGYWAWDSGVMQQEAEG